ncbi:GDSL esterase/lipase-like [Dorcoceras hygrometricum]|uniref:GDSL esterase/lipase-like n=1 Tax=Dorcoceras hygrometricum TaxID=472368 RepID=A0A2Z7D692_9LAMI|nr:GDSL esterase/lipase-like [Dorcoceras hygrometricum]
MPLFDFQDVLHGYRIYITLDLSMIVDSIGIFELNRPCSELLGFEKYIPRYANATSKDSVGGVNYGSGGAGILDETGRTLGDVISFNEQLSNHNGTIWRLAELLGGTIAASGHLRKCIYYVGLGNNDYLLNYVPKFYSSTGAPYTPKRFATLLISQYSKQLRILYSYGARKIAVFGTAPLGCIPQVLHRFPTDGKPCVEWINIEAGMFNTRMLPLVDQLNTNLPDAQFIYINYTAISYTDIVKFAEYLGFEDYTPPFASATDADYLTGVNYASGAGGILNYTNYYAGARYDLATQIEHHAYTVSQVERMLGNSTQARELLNKCVYVSNIGNNDYLNYVLNPILSPATKLYTPHQFADVVVQTYSQQLEILYRYGARKIAIFGTAPLGCTPQVRHRYPIEGKPCVEWINNEAGLFNTRMIPLIDQLNTNLPDAQFIFINYTAISYSDIIDSFLSGFTVGTVQCCVSESITGLCFPDSIPCPNRKEFLFWDNYHPTEMSNMAATEKMYNGSSPRYTYPMDLQQLALK